MAKKKSNSKKTVEEPMLEKIAGKLGRMTGEIIVAKNNFVDMAGGAIETVKEKIQQITEKKKTAPGKAVKATAKKVEKAVVKKVAAVKKDAKATVKKVEKKVAPARKAVKAAVNKAVKKAAPAKKAIKKTVKKVSGKK